MQDILASTNVEMPMSYILTAIISLGTIIATLGTTI